MSRFVQRLSRVAKVFGCPVHEEALVCQTCQPSEPMPEPLATGMHTLVEAIVARVPGERLAAAARRVGRLPLQEPCSRCGVRQTCMRCQACYGLALLASIGLSSDERDMLNALRVACRRIDDIHLPKVKG
jgi:hypothetical protein